MFESFHPVLTDDKSYPKYIQLRDQLEEYIKANSIQPGEQLPDIVSMCKIAGLSNRSVERAYIMLINDGICFRRPKKGTFVRGEAPVRNGSKPRICAIFDPYDPMRFEKDVINGRIYAGIQREAHRANIDLLILSERSISAYLGNPGFDFVGVIMLSWYNLEEALRVVSKYPDVKFLFLNYHLQGFEEMPANACGIFNDDFAGGFEATDYLIGRKRRNLCAITVKLADDNYERRLEGFRQALKLNGIEADASGAVHRWLHHVPQQDEQFAIGRELLQKALEENPALDGVFCTNDLLAAGVAAALDKLHLRPKIEVVGYDNLLPYLSANGQFSTVAINLELIGERAIKQLIGANAAGFPRIVNVAPRLMPRHWTESRPATQPQ